MYQASYKISEVIIHCSATRADWMANAGVAAQAEEIRRWHMSKGWRDIGYHHIIGRCGNVVQGRPETVMGAHVRGHNRGTIGVCLIGGHGSAASDKFEDHFTAQQERALLALLDEIEARAGTVSITGHNNYSAKACPGFEVSDWLPEARLRYAAKPADTKMSISRLIERARGVWW